jgi:catechol 2,3-dioxygenase-like lactoylglutathione lyase family enzyme
MKPLKLDQQITFLSTSDLETTAVFYEETVGLDLILDQGTCRIYATAPGAFLGFCEHLEVKEPRSGIIFTLVTDQVDAWYSYLLERGVAFEKPPEANPRYQIYHCFFRDPNGYLIEIQRFDDPRWNPDQD